MNASKLSPQNPSPPPPLANAPCFMEQQFPVARISAESYKERKAGASQTLTGLGKWWGRKPLVLVRAVILGLLLPVSDDPQRDRDVFLQLMTMDDDGLQRRKTKKLNVATMQEVATDAEREVFFQPEQAGWRTDAEIVWQVVSPEIQEALFDSSPTPADSHIRQGPQKKDMQERQKKVRQLAKAAKAAFEQALFQHLPYSRKLEYCLRPEQMDGPSETAWASINAHLNTKAHNLPEMVAELGQRRFGQRPRVGDAFCGAGSVPFEAARMGCEAYGSDLSPVAALLTWAALNIVGGGEDVAREVRQAQQEIFDAVDQQVTEWGIEHNEAGWRADAYLYCVEVICPECGWRVPLAPSWVIAEKNNVVAEMVEDSAVQGFQIEIHEGVTANRLNRAKSSGTVRNSRIWCPRCQQDSPIDVVRRQGKGKVSDERCHESGLRLWENDDLVPRPEDVFQERLYCIRWVEETRYEDRNGEEKVKIRRYYRAPTVEDLDREARVLSLLRERFHEWQEKGFIPSRRIEAGAKTDEPIRTRGWTCWHHLFTPRQLLLKGVMGHLVDIEAFSPNLYYAYIRSVGVFADSNSKLCRWRYQIDKSGGIGAIENVFSNQALNTMYNFPVRGLLFCHDIVAQSISQLQGLEFNFSYVTTCDSRNLSKACDVWITDPPYADAINYHELSEFFLAWYEKHLPKLFPDWHTDSRRALAIKADDPIEFRKSMVACYRQLTEHTPDNGMQVVMFTHQDAAVWADLTMILWAAGLRVTAAWCIGTETDSALKQGNYVQGTVLLVCRKRMETDMVFLDEINHRVEIEVRRQLDEMVALEDASEPNFADADYQLAAYAAALRVLTERPIEEINPEREIQRLRPKGETGPVEQLIRNAVKIACDHLVPKGLNREIWKTFGPAERFYLKGLEVETNGERRAGVYQELARGFGAADYTDLMASSRANQARLKTPAEFGRKLLGGSGFGASLVRQVLFAVHQVVKTEEAATGMNWLKTELADYWSTREKIVGILDSLAGLGRITDLEHWRKDAEAARILAGAVRNDHV